ncbi:hypothetical protein [Geodermatophilus sp. CPCC 205506]|uniref:hypothetical protein n=1 Tax=Geodermatophilus sp. CPCC 205506 TaxID=2936596 RepID=UPI003EEED61E
MAREDTGPQQELTGAPQKIDGRAASASSKYDSESASMVWQLGIRQLDEVHRR